MLQAISKYSVRNVSEDDTRGAHAVLAEPFDGVQLPGRHIEAQFSDGQIDVVVLSHGILNEEQIEFCILDNGKLLETENIGQMFQQGFIENIKPVGENALSFEFPAGTAWRVDFTQQPRWFFPFQAGPSRGLTLRSRMKFTRG